jgi:endoglucanase
LCFFCCTLFTLFSQTFYINYAEALQKSIYFYDAEKCGFTGTSRLEWRGPCHLEDAAVPLTTTDTNLSAGFIDANRAILDPDGDGTMNLIGGYHDAGDHVQFGLPQGYSASTLAWGLIEFKQAFIDTGNYDHMVEVVKYFTDFFLRCSFKDAGGNVVAYCYQTGDGSVDHAYWGPPELQDPEGLKVIGQTGVTYPRPAWFAYPEIPGSDVCAQAAASLAAMYLIMSDTDPVLMPIHACKMPGRCMSLLSSTGVRRIPAVITVLIMIMMNCHGPQPGCTRPQAICPISTILQHRMRRATTPVICNAYSDSRAIPGSISGCTAGWDAVWSGMFVRLSVLFPENDAFDDWARWNLEYWSGGEVPHEDESMGGGYLAYSPGGFGVINTWGSARYNTVAQLCALIYGKHHTRTDFAEWARGQMNYIMGDNPLNKFYIVGYRYNWVQHPHHRAAHGSFTNSMVDPEEHRHTLWGALASGPDTEDKHIDLVSEYAYNEVAVDYNAGFVGALEGLYDVYGRAAGHEPEVAQQFWMDGKLEQENSERTQVTVRIHAIPIHLPAPVDGLSCRYYFDISEQIDVGQTIDDINMQIYYDEQASRYGGSVTSSGPFAVDGNVYYYEYTWNGGVIGARELQFGLFSNIASDNVAHWDPTNDYSRQGLNEEYTDEQYIPFYHNGELVYGQEPGVGGGTPVPTSPATPTPTSGGSVMMGDVDDNGTVNIVDALLVAQYYVGLNPAL